MIDCVATIQRIMLKNGITGSVSEDANRDIDQSAGSPCSWYPTYVYNNETTKYLFVPVDIYEGVDIDYLHEQKKNASDVMVVLKTGGKNVKTIFIVNNIASYSLLSKLALDDDFGCIYFSDQEEFLEIPYVLVQAEQNHLIKGPIEYLATCNNLKGKYGDLIRNNAKNYIKNQGSIREDEFISHLMTQILKVKNGTKLLQLLKDTDRILAQNGSTHVRDHYYHACNTMFIGYVVLDKFYDTISREACKHGDDIDVEFIWAITSLLHDVGYAASKHANIACTAFGDEDEDPEFSECLTDYLERRWIRQYQHQATILENYFSHIDKGITRRWVYRPFKMILINKEFVNALREAIIKNSAHGAFSSLLIISIIDQIIEDVQNESDREYLYRNIIIASISILFHDILVRRVFAEHGINELQIVNYPFAALLTYIDILQDDRRDITSFRYRPDIFNEVIDTHGKIHVKLNRDKISASLKIKLAEELKLAFAFFKENGIKFVIPDELAG